MVLDVATIGSYLTLLLARGAGRWADRTLDHLLDRFATLVEQHIDRRTLKALQEDPGVEATNRASHKIEAAAQHDRALASELQAVIRELNRHGGRAAINQVQQNVMHGIAVGRDLTVNAPDPDDWSGAPSWVKMIFVMGFAVCALGIGIGFYMMSSSRQDGPWGLLIFFAGFVILAIGALGGMMRRRKWLLDHLSISCRIKRSSNLSALTALFRSEQNGSCSRIKRFGLIQHWAVTNEGRVSSSSAQKP